MVRLGPRCQPNKTSSYLSTAANSLFSLILRLSLSRTAERVSMSMSVNPSAVSASGVFLSIHSRHKADSWGSSSNLALWKKIANFDDQEKRFYPFDRKITFTDMIMTNTNLAVFLRQERQK